jgi:hypothetical protein
MENKLLTLLENDATLTPEQLSKMLEKEVGDIKKMILDYEKSGVIPLSQIPSPFLQGEKPVPELIGSSEK